MATYTSIVITYVGNNTWGFTDNTMPSDKYKSANSNSVFVDEDLMTFKTKMGGIIYNRQPYSIFSYVDQTDSGNNFTPTSAIQLESQLQALGFFGTSDGSGSGAIAFTDLTDTFSILAGREGQFLIVNEDGTLITTVDIIVPQRSTDLLDMPDVIEPNLFYVGNDDGTAIIQINPNFIIRPVLDFGMNWVQKGYTWKNVGLLFIPAINSDTVEEIGDYYSGCLYNDPTDPAQGVISINRARWNGGAKNLVTSFEFNYSEKIAFDSEPDSE